MRALIAILVVLFLILGVVFGALNPQHVRYDFLFAHFEISKGVALLLALLIGWLLGGALCWAGSGLARRAPRESRDGKRA
ncbi:MAG TPA: lipopolysaccharide assembly protein LapA domain-containing protein [Rhodanobacteraceae bacterium]